MSSQANLSPSENLLSTGGALRSPAWGDASQRSVQTCAAATVATLHASNAARTFQSVAAPMPRDASTLTSQTSATSSIAPSPVSPDSAECAAAVAEANAVATAAVAQAAAETAAAAAATAAAAAKAAEAAAAAAAAAVTVPLPCGDASQRSPDCTILHPMSPAPLASSPHAVRIWSCDASGRQLFGKELEAQLKAAAPEAYED